MDFSLAVAQIRAHRILDLIVKRGAGMFLYYILLFREYDPKKISRIFGPKLVPLLIFCTLYF